MSPRIIFQRGVLCQDPGFIENSAGDAGVIITEIRLKKKNKKRGTTKRENNPVWFPGEGWGGPAACGMLGASLSAGVGEAPQTVPDPLFSPQPASALPCLSGGTGL